MWAVISAGIVDILTTCRAVDWSESRRADKSGYGVKLLDKQGISLIRNSRAALRCTQRAERVEGEGESFPTGLGGKMQLLHCDVPARARLLGIDNGDSGQSSAARGAENGNSKGHGQCKLSKLCGAVGKG